MQFYGETLSTRLMLGTAQYPSPAVLQAAFEASRASVATVSLRRESTGGDGRHNDTLQPDVFGLVEAAAELSSQGFKVFPYCTEDLIVAEKLLAAGCEVLMPWGAPIGSGLGLNNVHGLTRLRHEFAGIPLVIDAGLGVPSHAAQAMELGFDAVLLNTAVARAGDPVAMAGAFGAAVEAGRIAFDATPIEASDVGSASTPVVGKAFLT